MDRVVKEQIKYWKDLTPLELRITILIMIGAWIKTIKMLLGGD